MLSKYTFTGPKGLLWVEHYQCSTEDTNLPGIREKQASFCQEHYFGSYEQLSEEQKSRNDANLIRLSINMTYSRQ